MTSPCPTIPKFSSLGAGSTVRPPGAGVSPGTGVAVGLALLSSVDVGVGTICGGVRVAVGVGGAQAY